MRSPPLHVVWLAGLLSVCGFSTASAQESDAVGKIQLDPADIRVTIAPFRLRSEDDFDPTDTATAETAWNELGDRIESGEIKTLMVSSVPYNVNISVGFLPGSILGGGVLNCRLALSASDRVELLNAIRTTIVFGGRNNLVAIQWGIQFLDANGTVVNTLELTRKSSNPPVSSFLNGGGPYVANGSCVNHAIIDWVERHFPTEVSFNTRVPRNCG